MTQKSSLRFFYNGVKGNDKKLQPCYYKKYLDCPDTIIICNDNNIHFTKQILDALIVENNTNTITSTFEKYHIAIAINHPMHSAVEYAFYQQERKQAKISKTF